MKINEFSKSEKIVCRTWDKNKKQYVCLGTGLVFDFDSLDYGIRELKYYYGQKWKNQFEIHKIQLTIDERRMA